MVCYEMIGYFEEVIFVVELEWQFLEDEVGNGGYNFESFNYNVECVYMCLVYWLKVIVMW